MASAEKYLRTCVGCGKKLPKGDLLRIVRTSDGQVEVDPTGRKAGRGAYVCSQECAQRALNQGKLGKTLRMRVTNEATEQVACEVEKAFCGAEGR